nr:unnamed protein product [Digitaria exilis]
MTTAGATSRVSSRSSTAVAAAIRRDHGRDSSLRMLSSCLLTSWPPSPEVVVAGPEAAPRSRLCRPAASPPLIEI